MYTLINVALFRYPFLLINIKLFVDGGLLQMCCVVGAKEERRKIDDAFRGNINGRLKHHLYRKLGSLNVRQEIYFQREWKESEKEKRRQWVEMQRTMGLLWVINIKPHNGY